MLNAQDHCTLYFISMLTLKWLLNALSLIKWSDIIKCFVYFLVRISERLWKWTHGKRRRCTKRYRHELFFLRLSIHRIHPSSLLFSAPPVILGCNRGVAFHACPKLSDTEPSRSRNGGDVIIEKWTVYLFVSCMCLFQPHWGMVVSMWGVDLSSK